MKSIGTMWALLALVVCWTVSYGQNAATEQKVKIKNMVGQVEIRTEGANQWRAARIGMPLKKGAEVRTFVESNADVEFANGTVLRIGENTVVALSKLFEDAKGNSSQTNVKVSTGQVWANVKKITSTKSTFDFETPTAVASIRGTQLGVGVSKTGTTVDVFEGVVLVRNRGSSNSASVGANTRAVVEAGKPNVSVLDFSKVKLADSTGVKYGGIIEPKDSTKMVTATDTTKAKPADTTKVAVKDSVKQTTPVAKDSVAAKAKADSLKQGAPAVKDSLKIRTKADSLRQTLPPPRDSTAGKPKTDSLRQPLVKPPKDSSTAVSTVKNLICDITLPANKSVVTTATITVKGRTIKGANCNINGKDVPVSADGSFTANVELEAGNNDITATATLGGASKSSQISVMYQPKQGTFVLTVTSPKEGALILQPKIPIVGMTSPGAKVTVNDAPVTVSSSGAFSFDAPIPDEPQTYTVTIVASLNDKELTEERQVVYQPAREALSLTVTNPANRQKISTKSVQIVGKTSPGASITINGRPASASPQGQFTFDIMLYEKDIGEYQIEIVASDGQGELSKSIVIEVDVTSPQINTSIPNLVVQGNSLPASKIDRLTMQVFDRTVGDQIKLTATNNNSTQEFTLDPGGKENLSFDQGKNVFSIKSSDKALNQSNSISGQVYYLPGPLTLDVVEPTQMDYSDVPPMPRNVSTPKLRMVVDVNDNVGNCPETIRYCKVTWALGQVLLRNNKDYRYTGEVTAGRGVNTYTIQTEDMAGSTATKIVTITIK